MKIFFAQSLNELITWQVSYTIVLGTNKAGRGSNIFAMGKYLKYLGPMMDQMAPKMAPNRMKTFSKNFLLVLLGATPPPFFFGFFHNSL